MKFLPLLFLLMTANVFAQTIDCQEIIKLKSAQKAKLNTRSFTSLSSEFTDIEGTTEMDTFRHIRTITKTRYKKGPKAGQTEEREMLFIDRISYTKSSSNDTWEFVERPIDTTIKKQFAEMKPRYENCHKVGTETIDGKSYDIIETTSFMKTESLDSSITMRLWVNFQDSITKKAQTIAHTMKGDAIIGVLEYGVDIKPIEKPLKVISQADNIRLNSNRAVPQYKDYTLYTFIKTNLVYPKAARDAKIEGYVYVNVTVEIDGSICDINVQKGLGYDCDEAAIEVVKKTSGNWLPALKFGKPIRASYRVPVKFKL